MKKMTKRVVGLALMCALLLALVIPAAAVNVDTHATAIAAGVSHSIALDREGHVYTWGKNDQGQLGLSAEVTQADTPTKVPDLESVTAVAAGYNFSLALRSDGTVVSWGNGIFNTPTAVDGLLNIIAIAAGQTDCLALGSDGNVYQWTMGSFPAQVPRLQGIVAIAAGGTHDLALSRTGEVWSWGANFYGQLGDGTTTDRPMTPQKVAGLQDAVDIAAGFSHSLEVDFSGNVYAWGSNDNKQLGTESVKGDANLRPMKVSGLKKGAQVAAGNGSSLAITSDGLLYAWGYGEYGQLGNKKSEIAQATPTQISGIGSGVPTGIACGVYHNMCVNSSGVLYAWGRNRDGQLGTGKTENGDTPVRIMEKVMTDTIYDSCVLEGASGWAWAEIAQIYPKGLVPPTMMGDYQAPVTRAELAHLLVTVYEAGKSTVSSRSDNPFNDIEGHPMKASILKAYSLGIINGTSKTTFSPYGQVTRQEAVTMLCRFVGKMQGIRVPDATKNLSYYDDAAAIASWATPYVDYAYKNNIMKGSGRNFSPLGLFTKEQSLLAVGRLANTHNWKAK